MNSKEMIKDKRGSIDYHKQEIIKDDDSSEHKKSMCEKLGKELAIDKRLLPIKAAIFMYVGGVTAFLPYLTLHMKEVGLRMEEIAVIYAVLPIASIIGPPLSGLIADKMGRYTYVLMVNILLTALFHSLLLVVPPDLRNIQQSLCMDPNLPQTRIDCGSLNISLASTVEECLVKCEDGILGLTICSPETRSITCSIELAMNATTEDNCPQSMVPFIQNEDPDTYTVCHGNCSWTCGVKNLTDSEAGRTGRSKGTTFYTYFTLRVIATMTLSSCFSMLDAVALAIVRKTGGEFGKQRLMTILSQAILPFAAGLLVDIFNVGENVNYGPTFFLGDAMLLSTCVVLFFIDLKVEPTKENLWKNMAKLLSKLEINLFLVIITILGANWGFLETYLFIYLDELKAPTYLLGLTLSVGCFSGVPAMIFSDYIVEKIGRENIFILSFVAYCIRFVGYSYIPSAWYCFPFEMLEVITYQIMWVAAATYCPILAPRGLLATMTGIAGAAHYSLGRGLGSFLGGYFISWFGLRLTFRGFGFAALAGGVLHFLIHRFILKKRIETREKLMALAENQSFNYRNDRASMDIINMVQNSSRRASYAV